MRREYRGAVSPTSLPNLAGWHWENRSLVEDVLVSNLLRRTLHPAVGARWRGYVPNIVPFAIFSFAVSHRFRLATWQLATLFRDSEFDRVACSSLGDSVQAVSTEG
jgi:hypothetical protein